VGIPRGRVPLRLVLCPFIYSTDLNGLRLLARFGECQVMTHPVAKRLFISSLIIKSFRGYYLPLDRGSYA
jgi:hypothetical protein